jgi:hypothetical protein
MIHTKRVIFMILPLLFVPLVYGLSSTPDACAAPMDPNYSPENCKGPEDKYGYVTCCWEKDGKKYCQACKTDGKTVNCGPVQGPIGLGQPPLFGRNEAAAPPTGGIEQPFTSAPFQRIPQDTVQGQIQPFLQPETPPTPTPIPTPPPQAATTVPQEQQTGPSNAPQDDEGEEQPEDNGQDDSLDEETAGPLTEEGTEPPKDEEE